MRNLVLCGAVIAPLALAAIHEPVQTESGLVSGTPGSTAGVQVFKSIPYAAPPLADLRWRPPQAAPHWKGVRKAAAFGHACIQDTDPPKDDLTYAWLLLKTAHEDTSEDCLVLNIWTAAKTTSDRRPVMVYFHGGALIYGGGDEGLYDGEALAKKGVVYVNVNYRLGVLGYLAHPELTKESEHHSSGNYGFLDQLAALEWVKRNVAAFGGDPDRVTIFGQSAGARSVNAHMASPLAKGLFRGVIAQSHGYFGGLGTPPTLVAAEQAGVKFVKDAGASSIAELRKKPAAELLKVQLGTRFRSNLNVDGWYMPGDIYEIFAAGKQNDVALMAGSDSDEASGHAKPTTADAFTAQARRRYGDKADTFLKMYPAGSDQEANQSQTLSASDLAGSYDARAFVQLQNRTGKSKAFLYLFSHKPPVTAPDIKVYDGVFHGAELYYLFQTYSFRKDWAWMDADRKLGDIVTSYWVNFAATGDPNGKGLPKWPAYDDQAQTLMNFGDKVSVEAVPHRAALDFFESFLHPAPASISRTGREETR